MPTEKQKIIDSILRQADFQLVTRHVKCKAGCSHCCHTYQVGVTKEEAELIFEKYFDKIDWDHVECQASLKLDDRTVRATPPSIRKCVFLKDDKCSIYEDRPMSCRAHLVISNPKKCVIERAMRPEKLILTPVEKIRTAEGIWNALPHALNDLLCDRRARKYKLSSVRKTQVDSGQDE